MRDYREVKIGDSVELTHTKFDRYEIGEVFDIYDAPPQFELKKWAKIRLINGDIRYAPLHQLTLAGKPSIQHE